MKYMRPIQFLFTFLALSGCLYAQAWSGILLPTYGSSTCNPIATTAPGGCAIDWTTAGIPGGIPSAMWTQSGSTIQASAYGNGSTDATSAIQSALKSCGTDQYVLLSAGTFLIDGNLSIPNYCVLRGAGANQTILNAMATANPDIELGTGGPNFSNAVSITSGATAGSTSIVVSSASGISAGMYLVISQVNDGTIVTVQGDQGSVCTWCDGGETSGGTRAQGQIEEVESVSGTTITISPPLYVNYSGGTPHATPFSATKYAGVENLQVYANNTHTSGDYSSFMMSACAYCWLSGVEANYTDGDWVEVPWGYHDEIVNSYFSNAFIHGAGSYDSDVDLEYKTTGCLVQNNIIERGHVSMMLEWGASGNVVAYNYMLAGFDAGSGSGSGWEVTAIDFHGAHPQFNLFEGNVTPNLGQDCIWGSSANNTFFRNWEVGAQLSCAPFSGRGTVTCASIGTMGNSGINGWWEFQAVKAASADYVSNDENFIGNVVGSTTMQSITDYGNLQPSVEMVVAVCGPSPCGSGSRPYTGEEYGYSFGYGATADTGGSTYNSLTPYSTALMHGEYGNITSTTYWVSELTQTLPPSFYLSSLPHFWAGGMPWPSIGPDVTGGGGPGGHVYSTTSTIPAQYCYTQVMGGTNSTGSPLTFNANTCYLPAPPSNLTAVAH